MVLYLASLRIKRKKGNVINVARQKTKKFRGSRTHGRGIKAGRGAGLRGGRGNAGLHKHKFMYMLKYMPDHFGVHGFKRPQGMTKEITAINVGQLEEIFPGKKDIDLTKEGIDKLLGGGVIHHPIHVNVKTATEKAIEKIQEKGGKVNVEEQEKEETPKESK